MQLHEIRLGSTDTTCLYYVPQESPWLGPRFLSMSDGTVAEDYYKLLAKDKTAHQWGAKLEEFLAHVRKHYEAAEALGAVVGRFGEYRYFWWGVRLTRGDESSSLSRKGWKEPFWAGHAVASRTIMNR